jgi:dihydroorotate dehydrogenase
MEVFKFLKPILFKLHPELAHNIAVYLLKNGLIPSRKIKNYPKLQINLWNKFFSHPIGLAAGFDKNANCINQMFKQGFSFMEAGTVTKYAQVGNPKPRLLRLEEDLAIINRMGFNNNGAEKFYQNIPLNLNGILGINIGKNKDSKDAIEDYIALTEKFYLVCDYITLNISSPNTAGLRDLQHNEQIRELLSSVRVKAKQLNAKYNKKTYILVKIAPDLEDNQIEDVMEAITSNLMDGVIISNTTIKNRDGLKSSYASEVGGLSGKPLLNPSNEVLYKAYKITKGSIPIIGVGGVFSGDDAYSKILAGASLVQLYSSIIYQGFGVIEKINSRLNELLDQDGFSSIAEAIGKAHK